MERTCVDTAVVIGVICQIVSIRMPSKSSDCLATMDTCMSDLCNRPREQAFLSHICDVKDEGCQIKGSKVCNLTVQATLEQFPSLRVCMCAWEEELCASLEALAAQCHRKPAQQKRSVSAMDWQSSNLIDFAYDSTGSCLQRMTVCIHDEVCNKHLLPLVQACGANRCNRTHCQQVTQQFYDRLPYNVAEMLVMCECDPGDEDCLYMKRTLHSGTCGEKSWTCLEGLNHCLGDWHCRKQFKTLQAKCWNAEDTQCSDHDECISLIMDPARIRGGDVECRKAFMATVGTALQYPCTCRGLHNDDLLKCNIIHDVLHNRSHFMTSRKKISAPHKPPGMNESERGHKWVTYQLLYVFVYLLLIGVVLLAAMVVFYKVRMLRQTEETRFHPPEKSNCIVIL